MNGHRYNVGDYVVLNDKIQSKYDTDDTYTKGAILQIIAVDKSVDLHYAAEIPKFLGDFGYIYIGDSYIDHEATAELNKDRL